MKNLGNRSFDGFPNLQSTYEGSRKKRDASCMLSANNGTSMGHEAGKASKKTAWWETVFEKEIPRAFLT